MEEQLGGLSEYYDSLMPLAVEYGMSIIGAILILILGWTIANWAARKVRKSGQKAEKIDNTLVPILAQIIRVLIIIITILAVLNQFGVETTSIVALLGAAGLAVGLALQGSLSNIAAGVMILALRPFKIGDAVNIGGTAGVVDEIGLFVTELHSFDNVGITMPNSMVWGDEIQNYSMHDTRRVDMVFGIGYNDDIDKAITILKDILTADDRVLSEPETLIAVGNLGDSSVDIKARPWCNSSDYWDLMHDITKKVKEEFDANDISIPFPQRDVHIFNQN
jgi:small conductance mechanosensitive channel